MKWAFLAAAAVVVSQAPCDARGRARAITVSSHTLGLRISKPAGWHTLTSREYIENLGRLDLPPDLRAALANHVDASTIAFTKFKEPYNNMNPTVEVGVRQINQLAGESASYILSRILGSVIAGVDGHLVVNISDATIGGRPAAYARIDSTLRAGGKAFPTASEIWVVPRGRYILMISASTRVDQANGTRAEMHRIVDSIRFIR